MRPLEPNGQSGMLFRVQAPAVGYNAQIGYFADLAPGGARVTLEVTDGTIGREIASAEVPQPLPAECELAVSARGNEIKVSLQGVTLIQTNDATFAFGSIGLRVMDTHAAFSQFTIEPLADGGVPAQSPAPSLSQRP